VGLTGLSEGIKSQIQLEEVTLVLAMDENIDDEGLISLSESLSLSLKNIKFDFSKCTKIGDIGLEALGKCLEKLSFLQKLFLNFSSCLQITNEGVLSLEKGLKEMKKDLFEVSLYFSLCKNVSSEVKKNLLAGLKDQYPLAKISGSE